MSQVDETDQEIEPEMLYLDFKDISNVVVEKKNIKLRQAGPWHPCIEKFFGENQDASVREWNLYFAFLFI